jgi:Zn-dependent protease
LEVILDILAIVREALLWIIPIMIAVIFHEVAHGYIALKLGDTTARDMGRLTLNPLPHIDPVGTILIPGILILLNAGFVFGYARPVPVNFMRLRNPKRGMALVALAGPATNILIALIAAVLIRLLVLADPGLIGQIMSHGASTGVLAALGVSAAYILFYTFFLSVILAIFNLIPIPPLDGGRIAVGLLPEGAARAYSKIEPFGMIIVIAILFLDPFRVFSSALSAVTGLISWLLLGTDLFGVLMTTLR